MHPIASHTAAADVRIFWMILLIFGIYQLLMLARKFGDNFNAYITSVLKPIPKRYRNILEHYFLYYNRLSPRHKKEFEKRLYRFILTKTFIPEGGLKEITGEMRVLIGATAVQLTFGLKEMYLQHFRYIYVYPEKYYSEQNQEYHLGEVNPGKEAIVISWKSFIKGYKMANDGYNVGLHEMAHALHLENSIPNEEYQFFNEHFYKKWEKAGETELKKIREGEQDFWRDYAGTSKEEFFAVCVESFFERPVAFQKENPRLYRIMVHLLQQDPIRINRIPANS